MFNHALLITRRIAAVAALTIVLGLAARTSAALALAPPAVSVPLIGTPHPVAPAKPAAPAARRTLWSRPLSNDRTTRRRCFARPLATAPMRGTSTRARRRVAAA